MPDYTIYTLDLMFLGQPHSIAAFLVIGPGGPVLVETGPGSTVPALTRALSAHGVQPADVRDVLVTHIHLDHAGAAGWWACQGARVHVHHVGAPHLIDPSRLLASALRIYGEHMERLWGEFLAVPEDRLHVLHDGDVIEAGGMRFVAHDTPGHARHHMLYQLGDEAFTGDLAGIRLAGAPLVRMPTPPPEFDLEAWLASIARVRALKLRRLHLTHFAAVDAVDAHWDEVERQLNENTALAHAALPRGREAVIEALSARDAERMAHAALDDSARAGYANVGPMGMAADGIIRYWQKKERTA
jgi:glyoxylase-like metal-dependent hydrolase (beta-lactamase superfamily II)